VTCSAGKIEEGSGQDRGTSDCVVIGKYIQTTDGTTFTAATVFGTLSDASSVSDTEAIKNAAPFTSSDVVPPSTYHLEWDARIVQPKTNDTQAPLNIFIARSPASGEVVTFVGHSTTDTPATIVDNMPEDTALCVDPVGFYTGDRLGALLAGGATNASGVKPITVGAC